MKFAACGDLHLTDKIPENRKAGYFGLILHKFEQLFKITKERTDTNLLVVAGDFFDSPRVPYNVTRKAIDILWKHNMVEVFAVPGQHDIRYHKSGLENTPLGVLETARLVKVLPSDKITVFEDVSFVGGGWNDPPKAQADCVLTHLTVTKVDPLYPGEEESFNAAQVLNRYKWAKCVVSGDNHKMFVHKNKKQLLVNCGSMVRSSKDQMEHIPCVHIIDTDTTPWNVESFPLDILPSEEVFDLNKISKKEKTEELKEKNKKELDDFISALSKTDKERPEFPKILKKVVEEIKPNKSVENLINEIMEEAQHGTVA